MKIYESFEEFNARAWNSRPKHGTKCHFIEHKRYLSIPIIRCGVKENGKVAYEYEIGLFADKKKYEKKRTWRVSGETFNGLTLCNEFTILDSEYGSIRFEQGTDIANVCKLIEHWFYGRLPNVYSHEEFEGTYEN